MIEAKEKSTATEPGSVRIHRNAILDSRLAIFHENARWLAVADLHYGYEISRRADGGLWPVWGMKTIEERFAALLDDYEPETVILVGDIVDGGVANREALAWLESVSECCESLVLVAGNHDRGAIRRELEFVESFAAGGGFFFHHGHLPVKAPEGMIEVTGHWHPSVSMHDGAGLSLRLPSLVQEIDRGAERWILPAFSPWASGGKWQGRPGAEIRQWICGEGRVMDWGEM